MRLPIFQGPTHDPAYPERVFPIQTRGSWLCSSPPGPALISGASGCGVTNAVCNSSTESSERQCPLLEYLGSQRAVMISRRRLEHCLGRSQDNSFAAPARPSYKGFEPHVCVVGKGGPDPPSAGPQRSLNDWLWWWSSLTFSTGPNTAGRRMIGHGARRRRAAWALRLLRCALSATRTPTHIASNSSAAGPSGSISSAVDPDAIATAIPTR